MYCCVLYGYLQDYGAIIDLFLFAWLICGSVWVYRIYGTVNYEDTADARYCKKVLYKFAFGVITATWSLVGLFFVFGCCMCCCLMVAGGS